MSTSLDFLTNESNTSPEGSVIWLHGLGADGHDFINIVPELNLPNELSLRFIFPHAPVRPIAINGNMHMRAWYNIYSLNELQREDQAGILASEQLVGELIEQEIERGIPSHKIILAGFSQGGAMSLYTGLRYAKPLAGILALSCYLPRMKALSTEQHTENLNIPILMTHGLYDPIVPIELAKATVAELKKLNYPIKWHEYAMQHQVCQQEIQDIGKWLISRFK